MVTGLIKNAIRTRLIEENSPAVMKDNAYRKGLNTNLFAIKPARFNDLINSLKKILTLEIGGYKLQSHGFHMITKAYYYAKNRGAEGEKEFERLSEDGTLFKMFDMAAKTIPADIKSNELREMFSHVNDLAKKFGEALDASEKIKLNLKLVKYVEGFNELLVEKYYLGSRDYEGAEQMKEKERMLLAQADSFIVRENGKTRILTGYENDTNKDVLASMIAIDGTLLSYDRFDEAKEVLESAADKIRSGAVTSDATKLVFAEAANMYSTKANDKKFLKEHADILASITTISPKAKENAIRAMTGSNNTPMLMGQTTEDEIRKLSDDYTTPQIVERYMLLNGTLIDYARENGGIPDALTETVPHKAMDNIPYSGIGSIAEQLRIIDIILQDRNSVGTLLKKSVNIDAQTLKQIFTAS